MSERYIPCQEDDNYADSGSDEQSDVSVFRRTQERHPSWLPTMIETARMIYQYEVSEGGYSDEQIEKARHILNTFGLDIRVMPDNSSVVLMQEGKIVGLIDHL